MKTELVTKRLSGVDTFMWSRHAVWWLFHVDHQFVENL